MQIKIQKLINVSDLSNLLICPFKVYFRVVEKKKEKLNEGMALGRIRHKLFEEFNRYEASIVSLVKSNWGLEQIEKHFEKKFNEIVWIIKESNKELIERFNLKKKLEKEIKKIKEEEIKVRARLVRKFVKKGFYGINLWEALTPKILSEIEIKSFTLGLKGRIDRIRIDETEIIPYEIKSRSFDGKIWLNEKIQLTGYTMLAERKYKTLIDYGFLKYSNKLIKVPITSKLRNLVLELRNQLIELIKERDLEKISIKTNKTNTYLCRFCSFKELCLERGILNY